ncbi:MAG: hypothetical protein KA118_14285 [Verrucomicrobia bacterium]|nr:hypothetical protein [Verrucomicrobiota bacterium]
MEIVPSSLAFGARAPFELETKKGKEGAGFGGAGYFVTQIRNLPIESLQFRISQPLLEVVAFENNICFFLEREIDLPLAAYVVACQLGQPAIQCRLLAAQVQHRGLKTAFIEQFVFKHILLLCDPKFMLCILPTYSGGVWQTGIDTGSPLAPRLVWQYQLRLAKSICMWRRSG